MPKKPARAPVQFRVVSQSYEDREYEETPKPVLVPVSKKTHLPKKPMVRFAEDMPNDEQLRRNMLMVDDTVEDRIFEDEVEENFDTDWIQQMMHGTTGGADDPDYDDEEFQEEWEDDQYPKHTERGTLERQFDRAMNEFADDEDIEEEDPRARGPLDVLDYAPALEQFVNESAQTNYWTSEPATKRGLINQLRHMSAEHAVFDSNAGGHFVTLNADKSARIGEYFYSDKEGLKELTLQAIRDGRIDTTDVLHRPDNEEPLVPVSVKDKELHDCETILSTYSNLYNRPSVVAAQTKRVKLTLAAAKRNKARASGDNHVDPGAAAVAATTPPVRPAAPPAANEDDADAYLEDLPDEALPSMIDLSTRPKNESAEEKKMRRALVKEMQRERRAEKKSTKVAYKEAGQAHAAVASRQKQDKKIASLSVVRRA